MTADELIASALVATGGLLLLGVAVLVWKV